MKFNFILFASSLMFLILSGCKKESGFLPEYDRSVPYYTDLNLDLKWSTPVMRGGSSNYISMLKQTSNLVLLISNDIIYAVRKSDGTSVWNYEPSYENQILGDFEIIETSENLMLFQKSAGGYQTILNKHDGTLIERGALRDLPGFEGSPISVEKWQDKLYILSVKYLSPDPSSVEYILYQLDPISRELTFIVSSEGNIIGFENAPILIDSIQSKLYFTYKNRENAAFFLNFMEVDLMTLDYRDVRIKAFSSTDDLFLFGLTPLAKFNNILFTHLDKKSGYAAIDISDGSILWTRATSTEYPYIHLDKLYIATYGSIQAFDPDSGNLYWTATDVRSFIFNDQILFHPQKEMILVKGDYQTELAIFDLHDGRVIYKLDAINLGNSSAFVGNSVFIESDSSVVVATDDFTIHSFKWPFK